MQLAVPAVLYRDDQCTVWHAGVVLGPPGVVVRRLDIDWVEARDLSSIDPSEHPLTAYIETTDHEPHRITGDSGFSGGLHALTFNATFPGQVRGRKGFEPLSADRLAGATLHLDIRSIGERLTIALA